jgi:hypothetical protein
MMKRMYPLFVVVLLALPASVAYAQEVDPEVSEEAPLSQVGQEELPNPNEIGALESKPSPALRPEPTGTKTSTSAATPSKPKSEKVADKEEPDADALSFNFLYYIIQKFKISDLKNN